MTVEIGAEETTPLPSQTTANSVAWATGLNAAGNLLSRVLGLVRESVLSNTFGASAAVDAFKIAITIPKGFYDLLIGGHVNSALIPVLSEYAEHHDEENLWDLVSALLNLSLLIVSSLVLVTEVLAPWLIRIVASDESQAQTLGQATSILRIIAPALLFMSLFAVLSSLLYALRRFTFPAFANFVFNLTIVGFIVGLEKRSGITAAAIGWLAGAIVQFALQWLGLWGTNYRFRLVFWHPAVKTIALLYAPVMFSLALDVLVNRPFSYNLASRTGEGSIAYMDWATTLVQFPHGLVAMAISIAVLPTLARQAAKAETLLDFKNTLGFGLRLTLALIIPATIGLIVLATPIVGLIFEHGAFTINDTAMTSFALRLYLLGLPFASIDLLLVFAFYARQDTLTPALIGLLSLVAYMVTAIFLLPYYSFFALMIADSVKHFIHASVSSWLLMRQIGWLHGQRLTQTALQATIAAAIMGIIALGLLLILRPAFKEHTLAHELVVVLGAGGVSGIFYMVLANILGIAEIQLFFQQIRQRL